jgi:hypothetical protein
VVEVVEYDEDDDEALRWYAIAAFVVAVVAGFAAGLYFFLSWTSTCADKEIGTTVAGDSTRAALCDSGHGAAVLVIPAAWLVGLGLASYALLKWGGGVRWAVLVAVLLLTPVALPAAAYGGLHLSGTSCSDDELAAYREWVDAGSKGTAPYRCSRF